MIADKPQGYSGSSISTGETRKCSCKKGILLALLTLKDGALNLVELIWPHGSMITLGLDYCNGPLLKAT